VKKRGALAALWKKKTTASVYGTQKGKETSPNGKPCLKKRGGGAHRGTETAFFGDGISALDRPHLYSGNPGVRSLELRGGSLTFKGGRTGAWRAGEPWKQRWGRKHSMSVWQEVALLLKRVEP